MRSLSGAACGLLALGGAIAAPAGFASAAGPAARVPAGVSAAATCDPDELQSRGDFDGDGSQDVAVGMPWYADGSGAVDVRGTGSPAVLLRAGALGGGTGEGDGFGTSVAIGDLDGDGCSDLVIGADAEGQSAVSDGAGGNEGQVHIVFGGPGGITTTGAITLPHDSSNLDHFGEALALTTRFVGDVKVHDLYVGAPLATVDGQEQAGEVFRYTITPNTGTRITATLREVRSQSTAGVPGASETGDGFGSVLTAVDSGAGVLVGAPNEDIGSKQDAGAVWFLRVDDAGAVTTSQSWSQAGAGVPGTAETADHFGAAIGSRGSRAVVGVPDENDGPKADSGMLQVLNRSSSSGRFAPGKALTQDSKGVPGKLEAGDRFGAAVVVGVWLNCQEATDLAAGAPGEDIGSHTDAGSITLISLDADLGCPSKTLHQGSGLAGAAESGDEVGSVLGLTRGRIDLDEDYSDRLLIGVPKENIGAVNDAGMVQPAHGGISADGVLDSTLKFSQGYLLSTYYGMVLSSASD